MNKWGLVPTRCVRIKTEICSVQRGQDYCLCLLHHMFVISAAEISWTNNAGQMEPNCGSGSGGFAIECLEHVYVDK